MIRAFFAMFWLVVLAIVAPGIDHRIQTELVPLLDAELDQLEAWRPPTVCRTLDKDGLPFDEFALERRTWMPITAMSPYAWQAVVAAEDRRFFDHRGVDPLGILRALVVNVRAGRIKEGGSTLTQQVVKNTVAGAEKSVRRKVWEALLALRLEQRMDKLTILELYLNYIFLGAGNYGLEAAARDYFGVSAAEIDAGQAALLAGLIPAPSAYSPRRSPELAAERRRIVLNGMVDAGFVDAITAQQAKRRPVNPPPREDRVGSSLEAAYATEVRREVRRLFGDTEPFDAGLQIFTPYNPALQAIAQAAVIKAADDVQRRQGHPGPDRRLRASQVAEFLSRGEGLDRVEGQIVAPRVGQCFPAVVLTERKVGAGGMQFAWSGGSLWKLVRNRDSEFPAQALIESLRWGDVYRVCLEKEGVVALPPVDWVQGAAVVIETATGNVEALVGGRSVPLEGFVRATQARRQPGSSFKPYVYAAALEDGMTQISEVLDAPLFLGGWSPKNSSGGYSGLMPMRTAFALSVNTVAVRLILSTGVDRVAELARAVGVQSRVRRDPTIALGSSEVTPLEHTAALSTFMRMGRAVPPVFVTRLKDVRGREVGRAGEAARLGDVTVTLPGGEGRLVVDPATAWQVVDMMRGVVKYGTGTRAAKEGYDRGGKTGTTSGFIDAWFVGFTATHTIGVWIGTDGNTTLGKGEAGGRAALPAWKAIADALPTPKDAAIAPPPEVVMVAWNGQWIGISDADVPEELVTIPHPGAAPLPDFPSSRPAACSP